MHSRGVEVVVKRDQTVMCGCGSARKHRATQERQVLVAPTQAGYQRFSKAQAGMRDSLKHEQPAAQVGH